MGNTFENIAFKVSTNSRDWDQNPMYALIYGIIVGWDEVLEQVAKNHNFSESEIRAIKIMRVVFKAETT